MTRVRPPTAGAASARLATLVAAVGGDTGRDLLRVRPDRGDIVMFF